MKKILIVLIFIVFMLAFSHIHWERRCWDMCFSLGYIQWQIGKFPYFYSLSIRIAENVEN